MVEMPTRNVYNVYCIQTIAVYLQIEMSVDFAFSHLWHFDKNQVSVWLMFVLEYTDTQINVTEIERAGSFVR